MDFRFDINFRCALKHSWKPEKSLEKLKVKTCSAYQAGSSSAEIQFTFCNLPFTQRQLQAVLENENSDQVDNVTVGNIRSECCRTNNFGWYNLEYAFWSGYTLDIDGNRKDDDGGDMLGPCEGFTLNGPNVYTYGTYNVHM